MNEDCVHTIYFDLQKYRVCNRFNGEDYSLLCKDLATFAINQGYHIVRNGFYVVGCLSAKRFSCSRCIQYKGDSKCRQSRGVTEKNESLEYDSKANRQWV